jgi:hypothetical protein
MRLPPKPRTTITRSSCNFDRAFCTCARIPLESASSSPGGNRSVADVWATSVDAQMLYE